MCAWFSFQTRKEVWFSLSRCSASKVNDLLHKFCVVVNSRKQDGISIPNATRQMCTSVRPTLMDMEGCSCAPMRNEEIKLPPKTIIYKISCLVNIIQLRVSSFSLFVCLFTLSVALVRNTWPSEPPQKPTQSFSVYFPFTAINSVNGFLMFFRLFGCGSVVCGWFHDYLTDWYQCKKKCPVFNLFYVWQKVFPRVQL